MEKLYVVKFYSNSPNPQQIPGSWPCEVKTVSPESASDFTAEGWTIMSAGEYNAYIELQKPVYDEWLASFNAQQKPVAMPFSLPAFSSEQKNLISPVKGMVLFNSDSSKIEVFTGDEWATVSMEVP